MYKILNLWLILHTQGASEAVTNICLFNHTQYASLQRCQFSTGLLHHLRGEYGGQALPYSPTICGGGVFPRSPMLVKIFCRPLISLVYYYSTVIQPKLTRLLLIIAKFTKKSPKIQFFGIFGDIFI